jgi:hypothetical protein
MSAMPVHKSFLTHLGLSVNIQRSISVVQGGHIGDVLILPLTLFLLQSERDTSDGTLLDSLHQVGGDCKTENMTNVQPFPSNLRMKLPIRTTRDLVPQPLGGDHRDLIENSLVGANNIKGLISLSSYASTQATQTHTGSPKSIEGSTSRSKLGKLA